MRTPLLVALSLPLLCACRFERREPVADSTRVDTTRTEQRALPPDSAVAWKFTPPPTWNERVRSVFVTEEDRVRLFQNARAAQRFDYLPHDTTVVPQTLLLITVYDSTAWTKVDLPDEPPVGEVITKAAGLVYVASLPQSNPFAEKSADFREFARHSVTAPDVRKRFQVVSR